MFRCPTEISSHFPAVIQAGIQFIKYDPVSLHQPRYDSLPLTVLRRTIPLRLKTKTKKWRMKMMAVMTKTKNLTSMRYISHNHHTTNF